MTELSPGDVTRLLQQWRAGDQAALARLVPLVHAELKRIASGCMSRERADHSLQTTALVNEAYLRLDRIQNTQWNDRAHFYAVSAQLMQRVLVEYARALAARKRRGADAERVPLDAVGPAHDHGAAVIDLLDLETALEALAAFDPLKAQMLQLRYFGGLTLDETAEVMGLSRKQVWRESRIARAWLLRALGSEGDRGA